MTLLALDFTEHTAWSDSSSVEVWLDEASIFPNSQSEDKTLEDTDNNILDLIFPHVPSLRRYLQARVPTDDVDDVLQDALLRILRRVERTTIERPKCYLFQVAQAALIDRHRRRTTRKAFFHCELMEEMHPVEDLHPLRILIARDEFRTVEGVLNKLTERTREIIIAVRLEGASLKALAIKYDISTSAIEKHVTKALKALEKTRDITLRKRPTVSGSFSCAA